MKFIDGKAINRYLDKIRTRSVDEAQHIKSLEDVAFNLIRHIATKGEMSGPVLPWRNSHDMIRFNPGALSVWAGINGHGKSLMLGQAATWWLGERQTVLIASLEMRVEETLYRMARQRFGNLISPDEGVAVADRLVTDWPGLYIYDQMDSVEADRMLALVLYACEELQVDHIIIDSLTKCGMTRDNYSDQAKFVDRLQSITKHSKTHVHLVSHMRKGESEKNGPPNKFDIRGASEVTDLADNVLIVWRNKAKEEVKFAQRMGAYLNEKQSALLDEPDALLLVEKNREHGHEGKVALWYHHNAMQYTSESHGPAMEWKLAPQPWEGASLRTVQ